jgi:hypothetical protein
MVSRDTDDDDDEDDNNNNNGARGSVVVKALCYKREGRGFDTRWSDILNVPT